MKQFANDLYYNKRWGVIPLKHKSKAPKLPNGHDFLHRKADEEEFRGFDFGNIGIVTGAVSGVVVLDIDDEEQAAEWLEEQGFELPETVSAKTPKGRHLYFKYPETGVGRKIKFAPGMDLLGDGGYVVAPPSYVEKTVDQGKGQKDRVRHTYTWLNSPDDTPIADCPVWVLDALRIHSRASSVDDMPTSIPEGSRNNTLFSRARSLLKQGYSKVEVGSTLIALNQERCTPPVDADELRQIVESASRYDRGDLRIEEPEQEVSSILQALDLGKALRAGIEPPEHLIVDLLYTESIHSIYSPGGTGKTILALWCAVQVMQSGQDVLYVDEENGAHHIGELLQSFGVDPDLISEHFKYLPAPGLTKDELEVWTLSLEHYKPALVVFDSLADHLSNNNLNENDSIAVTWWIKKFAQPAKDAGASVLCLDHIAKSEDAKGARGSGAKTAKVDVAWRLKCTTPFNRETTGSVELSVDKDRKGSMPYSRTFEIGGDPLNDKLTCQPTDVAHEPKKQPLTKNEEQAFDALWLELGGGGKWSDWKSVAGLSDTTFERVVKSLLSKDVGVEKDDSNGQYTIYPRNPQLTPTGVNK